MIPISLEKMITLGESLRIHRPWQESFIYLRDLVYVAAAVETHALYYPFNVHDFLVRVPCPPRSLVCL